MSQTKDIISLPVAVSKYFSYGKQSFTDSYYACRTVYIFQQINKLLICFKT